MLTLKQYIMVIVGYCDEAVTVRLLQCDFEVTVRLL